MLGMTNPPLVLDGSCLGKARACGSAGRTLHLGPGGQLGATAPVTVAGAVAVGHAETLAALVAHQLWNPGAPFVYGTGSGGAFDMRTFVDVWIAPEGQLADACAVQLATALGLPSWSYAGGCDAKTIDGQLAAEMAVTTLYAAQTGASLYHDLGEFEAAAQNSIESLVLGDALVGMTRRLLAGVRVDDETLQLDDIAAVGPGGSFLARPYTRAHHRDVWSSPLFDTSGFEAWAADGSRTLEDRLHEAALEPGGAVRAGPRRRGRRPHRRLALRASDAAAAAAGGSGAQPQARVDWDSHGWVSLLRVTFDREDDPWSRPHSGAHHARPPAGWMSPSGLTAPRSHATWASASRSCSPSRTSGRTADSARASSPAGSSSRPGP